MQIWQKWEGVAVQMGDFVVVQVQDAKIGHGFQESQVDAGDFIVVSVREEKNNHTFLTSFPQRKNS